VYFSLVTIVIFAITCLTFVVYDFWVERRQKVVMKTAVTTTKLVSELFPDVVMDKVLPSSDHSVSYSDSQPKRLKSFLTDSKTEGTAESSDETNKDPNNKTGARSGRINAPIAELFPETTVFFADIAGFTSWSSEREPAAVFTLLESIYGAFDKIAKKFNIFKVETIGDSYVAVS
jgi:hypothetical protein